VTTTDLIGKILQVVLALAGFAAVLGLILFFVDRAPKKGRDVIQLLAFLLPAVALVGLGLVYPAVRTTLTAFGDKAGNFIGLDNFVWMFTQPEALVTLRNTVIWVILVPLVSTVVGLAYAVFIDKSRGERIFKVIVFMPVAISLVGAGIIWKFVYEYRPTDVNQIGLLNQILVWFGQEPVLWLQSEPINTLMLIVVMIWVQTGFAMVILSASIKGVSVEQLEAAELDGTNAWQRFRNVTLPGIRGGMVVVVTTITIATLKVFDIVRTMTAGNFNTSVVANEMYTQAFRAVQPGRGAALAVILFLMVLPIVLYNVRVMRQQKEIR
jgi:alpha-glucoside transport system permease protein